MFCALLCFHFWRKSIELARPPAWTGRATIVGLPGQVRAAPEAVGSGDGEVASKGEEVAAMAMVAAEAMLRQPFSRVDLLCACCLIISMNPHLSVANEQLARLLLALSPAHDLSIEQCTNYRHPSICPAAAVVAAVVAMTTKRLIDTPLNTQARNCYWQ